MILWMSLLACGFAPEEGTWTLTVTSATAWDCTAEGGFHDAGETWPIGVWVDDKAPVLDLGHVDDVDDCSWSEDDLSILCQETRVDDYSTAGLDAVVTWTDTLSATFVNETRMTGDLQSDLQCEGADCQGDAAELLAPDPQAGFPCVGSSEIDARF